MDQISFISSNVHVWLANLSIDDQVFNNFHQYLSPDERRRADHYAYTKDRRNYISSHGILRNIMACYLHCHPVDVAFMNSIDGKPALDLPEQPSGLEFNLSHSSGFAAIAVTQGLKVGIDIELVHLLPDMDLIAAYFFSDDERAALSKLPDEEKMAGFFRCWTRKEAYLKAIGRGLSIPLDSFDVSLAPGNPIRMHSNRIHPDEVSRWSFYTFIPEHGFSGALVIDSSQVRPNFRLWEPDAVNVG